MKFHLVFFVALIASGSTAIAQPSATRAISSRTELKTEAIIQIDGMQKLTQEIVDRHETHASNLPPLTEAKHPTPVASSPSIAQTLLNESDSLPQ